jgi:hypothetical protein
VQGTEDLALGRLLEDPAARLVAELQQIGRHAGPVAVHVDRQGRRRCDVRQPQNELRVAIERQPAAAELGGHRGEQVARSAQFLEVLVEEPVLTVVHRRPLVEPGQHVVGQQIGGCGDGHCVPSKSLPVEACKLAGRM